MEVIELLAFIAGLGVIELGLWALGTWMLRRRQQGRR
jgi:hypothetical protein